MTLQMKPHGRAGSRSSLSSVGQMPVISEDGHSPVSPALLRLPQKQSRKNQGGRGSITPPPPYAASPGPNGMRPPPIALLESKEGQAALMAKELGLESPQFPQSPLEEGVEGGNSQWQENRSRRCRFVALLCGILLVTVGLAVGLSLGLSKRRAFGGHASTGSSSGSIIGSFALDASLQSTSTGCTSNPTTWRCYPYSTGSVTHFYWSIEQADGEYRVSSLDGSSAALPGFANLPLTLLDDNLDSERFVFSFQANKTVPSSASGGSNRAARCTFGNTAFQAVLWTRRRGQRGHTGQQSQYPAWPGVVEVLETSDSVLGSLECEDDNGNVVSDVRAGAGVCECLYRTANTG